MTARKSSARASLGMTELVPVKMHPDLKAHVDRMAEANYCSPPEYVRQLILADMRLHGEGVTS